MEINVRSIANRPGALPIEIVEHKGLGHPDSVCDWLAEELCLRLSRFYAAQCGAVQHHNVDKALLIGGVAAPAFGGGEVTKPIEIYLAGRATAACSGRPVPIEDLAREGTAEWLRGHFHALDPAHHVKLHCRVRPGSPELIELFERAHKTGTVLANDTSCGVGFAPLSEMETVVAETARALNGPELSVLHPAIGEDIKIMGLREGRSIHLTVACAMIGGFLKDAAEYMDLKARLTAALTEVAQRHASSKVAVEVNTADAPDGSEVYLTVTGTSAECGDDGEAGRGNRVNGLITPMRPMTMESVAGKNPISHVGKLYNLAAGLIAGRIVAEIPEALGAECCLVSQIGRPVKEPRLVGIGLQAADDVARRLQPAVAKIAADELGRLDDMWRALNSGEIGIGRWPFSRR
jgi:S-adenosylmethionine synthetase